LPEQRKPPVDPDAVAVDAPPRLVRLDADVRVLSAEVEELADRASSMKASSHRLVEQARVLQEKTKRHLQGVSLLSDQRRESLRAAEPAAAVVDTAETSDHDEPK
jgi:hypothetical protein